MNYSNVMIDLETLGTAPGSVILSIGAVAFNEGQDEGLWATFNSGPINVAMQRRFYGLSIDESTLAWWLNQDMAASQILRAALEDAATSPTKALGAFRDWFPIGAAVWGNGANFDGVLLRAMFTAAALACPWPYYDEQCYRTMKKQFSGVLTPKFQGVKHDALSDALHQTRHLQRIWASVKEAR